MKIVIAEKPDQAAKLAAPFAFVKKTGYFEILPNPLFSNGAIITWAIGHLCELKAPEEYHPSWKKWTVAALPIIPEQFEYKVTPSKWKQFQIIKQLLKRLDVTEIIIGGDAGREGELIIRTIIHMCGAKKPMKRLWISSLTEAAVKKGFTELLNEEDTRHMYNEALSRACSDWVIGINCSRVYTILLKEKGVKDVFSIGRVQTPTLALIVKREKEIAEFHARPFWEVEAIFHFNGAAIKGTWHKENETRIQDEKQARAIAAFCENKQVEITKVKKEKKEYPPPLLFNLSALQAAANKIFKFSPQKTLDVLQKLYLKGFVSYPRSDSQFLTKEEALGLPNILQQLAKLRQYQELLPPPNTSLIHNKRYVNEKKVTDHHAIIPTEQVPAPSKLHPDEEKMYDLIVRQVIAAHYPHAVFAYTTINSVVDSRATFLTKGKEEIKAGWRKVIYEAKEKKEEQSLPKLEAGNQGNVVETSIRQSETQPPPRYTEGNLITLMKTAGKHLTDSELEKVMANTEGLGTEATRAGIISLLKDRHYIEITKNQVFATKKGMLLIDVLGDSILTSPSMTAKWEQRLSEIGQGKASSAAFFTNVKKLVHHLVNDAIKKKEHWVFDHIDLDSLNPTAKKRPVRSNSPIGNCPQCNGAILDRGKFYGCSNYKKNSCTFTISKKLLGKNISQTNVKKLLTTGESNVIKNFKKGDKMFDAALCWNKGTKKVEFKFSR